MCLQRLGRVRNNARLFHLVGNGIGTVRLIVSSHQFQKFVQTVFHVFNLGTKLVSRDFHDPCCLPDRTFRTSGTVVCKLRNRCFQLSSPLFVLPSVWVSWGGTAMLQTAVRVVQSPSPLLVIVLLFSARQDGQDRRVSVECEIPVVKVFARCVRLWLSDSHVLWTRFRHRLLHCSHGFRVPTLLLSS